MTSIAITSPIIDIKNTYNYATADILLYVHVHVL